MNKILDKMSESVSSVINQCCPEQKDKIGAYRAINNGKYMHKDLIECLQRDCATHVMDGEHVLCIEDTSEFDYHRIGKRLKDGDPDVGKGSTDLLMHSFFLHPTLVVSAETGEVRGFSSIELFNREASLEKPEDRHKRPIEEKESYRWVTSASTTAETLPQARKTMVCDREGDAFDIMQGIKASGCDFLIRSKHDRQELSTGKRLRDSVSSMPLIATFSFKVLGNGNHSPHTARMELRFKKVEFANVKGDTLSAWCVLASESSQTVPHGEDPIVWYLLTSHPIETVEQATECVRWYRMRWNIEELFRTLKSKGFNMEGVQLETGKAIKKLLILTMQASLTVMRMKQSLDCSREDIEASTVLGPEYIKVLEIYDSKYRGEKRRNQGNTNPYRKGSLPWAAWITARLGGWSGYEKAHGKPGRITLCEGFQRLTAMVDFNIAKEEYGDVYKD